jgi:hypothetical protein
MEYDPEPPFNSGSPKTAAPATIHQAMMFMAAHMEKMAERRHEVGHSRQEST